MNKRYGKAGGLMAALMMCALAGAGGAYAQAGPATQSATMPAATMPAEDAIPDQYSATWKDANGETIVGAAIKVTRDLRPTLEMTSDAEGKTWVFWDNSDIIETTVKHPTFEMVYDRSAPELSNKVFKVPVVMNSAPSTTITGRVLTAEGKPAAGAWVKLVSARWESGSWTSDTRAWHVADENGQFKLPIIKPGWAGKISDKAVFTLHVQLKGAGQLVPLIVKATADKTVEAQLINEPRRNITLIDSDGKPVAVPFGANDMVLSYRPDSSTDSYSIKLETLKNLALPPGRYTVSWRGHDYGPGVVAAGQPAGDLKLVAPERKEMLLTVVDGLTGKPMPEAMVVADEQTSEASFLSYMSPEQWAQAAQVKGIDDTGALSYRLRNWYASMGANFKQFKTDSLGQARMTWERRVRSQGLYAMVFGPKDFPWVQWYGPEKNEATLYRLPAAMVTMCPQGVDSPGNISAQIQVEMNEKGSKLPWMDHVRSWYVSGVDPRVVNKVLVPAGVPVKLVLEGGRMRWYESPVFKLEPGQTLDLGKVRLRTRVPFTVVAKDRMNRRVTGVEMLVRDPQGKWKPLGTTDQNGNLRKNFEAEGPTMLGFRNYGQSDEEVPEFQFQVEVKSNQMGVEMRLDMDFQDFQWKGKIGQMETIAFTDALGKPMPAGTQIRPVGGVPALRLDENGKVPGKNLAKVFASGMTVSHPDYGTALIQGGPQMNLSAPIALPLAHKSISDSMCVFKGKLEDSEGKPVGGMRVMPGSRWVAGGGSFQGMRQAPVVAISESDGTFRVHLITAGTTEEQIVRARSQGEQGLLMVFSDDLWTVGWQAKMDVPNKDQVVKISRAAREFTIAAKYRDGRPMSPSSLNGYFQRDEQSPQIEVESGWLPASGKRPMAYGTYFFQGEMGRFEPLVVDEKSPDTLTLTYPKPVKVTGVVTEAGTGTPIAGALLMVGSPYQVNSMGSIGVLSKGSWTQIATLPESPMLARDLPEQLLNQVSPSGAALSDGMGEFVFADPGAVGYQGIYVVAQGYVPAMGRVNLTPEGASGEVTAVPQVELTPAATVALELETLPSDLETLRDAQLTGALTYQVAAPVKDAKEKLPGVEWKMILPKQLPQLETTTVCLPAGVPVKVWLDTRNFDSTVKMPALMAGWEMTDGPRTFKHGEFATVKLARVKLVAVKVRFERPDGKPLNPRGVGRIMAQDPRVRYVYDGKPNKDGVTTLALPAGRKSLLWIAEMSPDQAENKFEVQVPETPDSEPIVIKLNESQAAKLVIRN